MAEKRLRSITEIDFSVRGSVYPSPEDWRDHVIYFLLVDRFDNGKRSPIYNGVRATGQIDPRKGDIIHGGTIKGIKRRLTYLKNLGITTLWLSPIIKNRVDGNSIHGYAIQDFLSVDPHFGTLADFKKLVSSAHELGIRIVLDIVINHTGDNWAYENDSKPLFDKSGTRFPFGFWRSKSEQEAFGPDDAVWPIELQSPECYTRRGAITDWNDDEQARRGDFFGLKDLDLSNQSVLETMIAVYKYWIVETDIDGYRIDTVKHIDTESAVTFFNAIKEFAESIGKRNFLLFGEIVADDSVIATYVGLQNPNGNHLKALDASLDFPLYFVLEDVLKERSPMSLLRDRHDRALSVYQHANDGGCLITFLDNHDQIARPFYRFLHGVNDPLLAVIGVGYLLTAPGIPAVYYGTEQGFDGGGVGPYSDNYIRECMFGGVWGAFGTTGMHFFDTKNYIYRMIAKIAGIRAREAALRYGRCYFRDVSLDGNVFWYPEREAGLFAFSRMHDNDEILVVFNFHEHVETNMITLDKAVTPPGTLMVDLLNKKHTHLTFLQGERSVIQVTLPPRSMAIYKRV